MTPHSEADGAAEAAGSARRQSQIRRRLRSGWKNPRGRAAILASIALIVAGALVWVSSLSARYSVAKPTWFGGYVDVTLNPPYPFETGPAKDVILAFVVGSPQEPCTPSWGTHYTLDAAAQAANLDSRLESFKARGGRAAISFGGSLNLELANSCLNEDALASAYRQVLERYNPVALDFDIEGDNLLDTAAGQRRAKVIGQLQREEAPRGRTFDVWLTLPVSPHGLTAAGVTAVDQMLDAGVQLTGVNVMTMNYGESRAASQSMVEASISAATAAHDQLHDVYQRAGLKLSGEEIWQKMGLTPMIGQNDLPGETFDLGAAQKLRDFAVAKNALRLSMWSLNRDIPCQDEALSETASHVCSGVSQQAGEFSQLLGGGLTGRMG